MSTLAGWVEAHTLAAPPALAERVRWFASRQSGPAPAMSHALAAAGAEALAGVTAHPGGRAVALDLLAADALITLALLEQAERDPAGLAAFAAELLRRHGSPA